MSPIDPDVGVTEGTDSVRIILPERLFIKSCQIRIISEKQKTGRQVWKEKRDDGE